MTPTRLASTATATVGPVNGAELATRQPPLRRPPPRVALRSAGRPACPPAAGRPECEAPVAGPRRRCARTFSRVITRQYLAALVGESSAFKQGERLERLARDASLGRAGAVRSVVALAVALRETARRRNARIRGTIPTCEPLAGEPPRGRSPIPVRYQPGGIRPQLRWSLCSGGRPVRVPQQIGDPSVEILPWRSEGR